MYPPIEDTIALAKRQVIEDVHAGYVPFNVASFSQLHDYRDANYYGNAFELGFDGSDECVNYWNAVQDAVDSWIKSGELKRAIT
jgi:hypothetical protein